MRHEIGFLFVVLAMLLVITPVLVGCAAEEPSSPPPSEKPGTPEVKKPDELLLNFSAAVSGPYAEVMGSLPAGCEDWTIMTNEAGGVLGVPVRINFFDTRNDRAVAMSQYVKLKDEGVSYVSFLQLADAEMLVDRATEDKIVNFSCTCSAKTLFPPRANIATIPMAADQCGTFINWLSQEWEKRGETEKCRLALLNPDNPTGHAMGGEGVTDYIKTKPNLELVANEYCDWRATDLTTDVGKLWQTKPDWIYTGNLYGLFVAFLKATATLGIRDKVEIGTYGSNADLVITKLAGKELVSGIILDNGFAMWSDDNPGMTAIKQQFEKSKRPEGFRQAAYLYGSTSNTVPLIFKILELTVEKYGWDGLVYDNIINTFETTDSVDLPTSPSCYLLGKKHCTGNSRLAIFDENGVPTAITDWKKIPADLRDPSQRNAEWGWKGIELQ